MKGKVYIAGAGPGSPDLITVRGLKILREADVIVYDYLVPELLLEESKRGALKIRADKLGARRGASDSGREQDRVSSFTVRKAKEGKKVLRLKNGDVSIFSRLSQELETLGKNGIEYEIVPGVTSASAASAYSGIPLTDREKSSTCVFVTGRENPKKKESGIDWQSAAKQGTIVVYMGIENIGEIVRKIVRAGKDVRTPAAVIQEASLPSQKIVTGTLADIAGRAIEEKIVPPGILIIGESAGFEKRFNWLRKNGHALFTGLSGYRPFLKGTYTHLPLIKIIPAKSYRRFDSLLKKIRTFDWIVFGSRYAAEYFFRRLRETGLDARVLAGIKIAAVGESTRAKLLQFSISADLVPGKESSRGLIEEFGKIDIRGKHILLPRSDLSDKNLEKGLTGSGARVTRVTAYRNVIPENLPDINWDIFDEIMFTSPSTVRNFIKRYGTLPRRVKVRCIGDVTLKEAKRWRLLN